MPDAADSHSPDSAGVSPRSVGLIGKRLGPYEIVEELGQGGMSVVYRARDVRLQREVAVKVLHPFLADRDDARQRFAREALAVAKIQHPNILQIFDFHEDRSEQSYLVMELVNGETLRVFCDRAKVDPPEVAALIGSKLCTALEQAHRLGIVHRDVKPENVMVDDQGNLKLMDFGIAHMRDARSLTITGTLLGSPAHMAPEAIEGRAVDERSDQFSLGTILYWMATGRLPFDAKNPHALLKRIAEGRYTAAQRVNPKISDHLAAIIARTLDSNPELRFPDIGELRDELTAVAREAGIVDVDDTLARFAREPQPTALVLTRAAVDAFTRAAQDLEQRGETAQALSALNHVLALEPTNSEATRALETLTRRLQRASSRQYAQRIGAAVALLAALCSLVYFAVLPRWQSDPEATLASMDDGEQNVSTSTDPMTDSPGVTSALGLPAVSQESLAQNTSVADSGSGAAAKPGQSPAAANHRASGRIGASDPVATAAQLNADALKRAADIERAARERVKAAQAKRAAESGAETQSVDDTSGWREVRFRVDPWADIYLGEEQKAKGAKTATLKLLPGEHVVRFDNTYAAPLTQRIVVPAEGDIPELRFKLEKMKPAYLVVHAEPDGDVKVAGRYKGPAEASQRNPIVVPMPDRVSQAQLRVEISKPGYRPHVVEQQFVPGQTAQIRVTLEPLGSGGGGN